MIQATKFAEKWIWERLLKTNVRVHLLTNREEPLTELTRGHGYSPRPFHKGEPLSWKFDGVDRLVSAWGLSSDQSRGQIVFFQELPRPQLVTSGGELTLTIHGVLEEVSL